MIEKIQWILATLTLLAGCGVVFGKNPVISALSLMVTMFLTGLLYFSQGSYFPAVVQILIYAGAISVLFIFIVMLLDLKTSRLLIPGRKLTITMAFFVAAVLFVGLAILVEPSMHGESLVNEFLSVETEKTVSMAHNISLNLLTKYMLPFQATSLLLLGAMMGAVVIGRSGRRKDQG